MFHSIVLYLSAKLTKYTKDIKNITWSIRLMDSKLSQQQLKYTYYYIRTSILFLKSYFILSLILDFCFIWRHSSVLSHLFDFVSFFTSVWSYCLCFFFIKKYFQGIPVFKVFFLTLSLIWGVFILFCNFVSIFNT